MGLLGTLGLVVWIQGEVFERFVFLSPDQDQLLQQLQVLRYGLVGGMGLVGALVLPRLFRWWCARGRPVGWPILTMVAGAGVGYALGLLFLVQPWRVQLTSAYMNFPYVNSFLASESPRNHTGNTEENGTGGGAVVLQNQSSCGSLLPRLDQYERDTLVSVREALEGNAMLIQGMYGLAWTQGCLTDEEYLKKRGAIAAWVIQHPSPMDQVWEKMSYFHLPWSRSILQGREKMLPVVSNSPSRLCEMLTNKERGEGVEQGFRYPPGNQFEMAAQKACEEFSSVGDTTVNDLNAIRTRLRKVSEAVAILPAVSVH